MTIVLRCLETRVGWNTSIEREATEADIEAAGYIRTPIPMLLYCPMCHERHVDKGEFATKPHHTHACQNRTCGHVWRPAVVPTVGVYFLPGFMDELEKQK